MYDIDFQFKKDRLRADKKYGKLAKEKEDLWSIFDSLIICKFIRKIISDFVTLSEYYTAITGFEMTPKNLRKAGERIYTLEKLFNIREGWTKRDDYPPPRIMLDPISTGVSKGSFLRKEDFELMLNAYYEERGWNQEGIPSKQKLENLKLSPVNKESVFLESD